MDKLFRQPEPLSAQPPIPYIQRAYNEVQNQKKDDQPLNKDMADLEETLIELLAAAQSDQGRKKPVPESKGKSRKHQSRRIGSMLSWGRSFEVSTDTTSLVSASKMPDNFSVDIEAQNGAE